MVTRRAVLKGTAAASIGAIAAAHGAKPVEAAAAGGCGFGNFAGGALGGFYKERDAFQIAIKFHKFAAEIFIKETLAGVEMFSKFFHKDWVTGPSQLLSSDSFPNLADASLGFHKIDTSRADFFLKLGNKQMDGFVDVSTEKLDFDFSETQPPDFTDGQIT